MNAEDKVFLSLILSGMILILALCTLAHFQEIEKIKSGYYECECIKKIEG